MLIHAVIAAAMESTCLYQRVGAVVAHGEQILGQGANHTPRGLASCSERGYCSIPRHDCSSQGSPSRAIHAEVAAIADAVSNGQTVKGAVLYCTHKPCENCLKVAVAFGITRIIYQGEPYPPESEWHDIIKLDSISEPYPIPQM